MYLHIYIVFGFPAPCLKNLSRGLEESGISRIFMKKSVAEGVFIDY
jgi:hypothetical protein